MSHRRVSKVPETPMVESTTYTSEMLVNLAWSQGKVKITNRQIEEWHKAGFLPEPIRVKLPNQGRGRPPYSYPAAALDAVIWLGKYRGLIDGTDTVQFWMRVEGFEFVTIDVNDLLRDRLEQLWAGAQSRVPSLPDLDQFLDTGLPDLQREVLLDEIDANVTAPLLAQPQQPTDDMLSQITLGAAMLGILPGLYVADNQQAYEWFDLGPYFPYADALLGDSIQLSDKERAVIRAMLPDYVENVNVVNLYRIVRRKLLTNDILPALRVCVQHSLRTTEIDVPRECHYEPIVFIQMALMHMRFLLGGLGLIALAQQELEKDFDAHAADRAHSDHERIARSLRSRLEQTYASPIYQHLAQIGAAMKDAATKQNR